MAEELKDKAVNAEEVKAVPEEKQGRTLVSEVGVIACGTKVTGDIITDGHLNLEGNVEGNIDALGAVNVTGSIKGDVKCGSFSVSAGTHKVNIDSCGEVAIGKDACVEGNIKCGTLVSEGKIKGNVSASESIKLASTAFVSGELVTKGIAIGMGAVVNGSIKMNDK